MWARAVLMRACCSAVITVGALRCRGGPVSCPGRRRRSRRHCWVVAQGGGWSAGVVGGQPVGQECCGVVDVIGPAPAGGAHVGFQRGSDLGGGADARVDISGGQDVADRADVRGASRDSGQPGPQPTVAPQRSWLGAPAPARPVSVVGETFSARVRVLGELLPTEGKDKHPPSAVGRDCAQLVGVPGGVSGDRSRAVGRQPGYPVSRVRVGLLPPSLTPARVARRR